MDDLISRQAAIKYLMANMNWYDEDGYESDEDYKRECITELINGVPSAQSEEVIPHRNYKYLSDYWCECGWHLGKKGEVKYCSECGRKVNWDECTD